MSHTSAFETCRIHHNGGYDGDVTITNEDSTSRPIGPKATIRSTSQKLMKQAVICYRNGPGMKEVTIVGIDENRESNYKGKITVESADIMAYASCVLEDRITRKMENSLEYEDMVEVAKSLGIPTEW